jgi:hypothetical protein
MENLHLPVHQVTAAVLRNAIQGTLFFLCLLIRCCTWAFMAEQFMSVSNASQNDVCYDLARHQNGLKGAAVASFQMPVHHYPTQFANLHNLRNRQSVIK